MGGYPEKRELAKEIVLRLLSSIYHKKVRGEPLSEIEHNAPMQKKTLAAYVLQQEDIPLEESGMSTQKPTKQQKARQLSISTINNAIDDLRREGRIDIIDGQYQYKLPKEEICDLYPILRIAKAVRVTPLDFSEIMFFRVDPQYSASLTDYINGQLPHYDIYAINLGNTILCGDLTIPKSSTAIEKKRSFRKRLGDLFEPFPAYRLREFNEKLGVTQEAIEENWMNNYVEMCYDAHEKELLAASEHGGTIKQPSRRKTRQKEKSDTTE